MEIKLCTPDEIQLVMSFIHREWKEKHILSTNKDLLDWQHLNINNTYNYLIAKNENENEIEGVLGFIPTNRFQDGSINTIWLALWKASDKEKSKGSGLKLYKHLSNMFHNSNLAVNGITEEVRNLYRAIGFVVVDLSCFFITNENLKQNVIKNSCNMKINYSKGDALIEEIQRNDLKIIKNISNMDGIVNHKNTKYFLNKYLNHPFYKYKLFKLTSPKCSISLIAAREVKHNNSKILRIVDFSGDSKILAEIGSSIRKILKKSDYEYVDFWQYGININYLKKSGFMCVDDFKDIVVPNFFEPFLRENGKITSAFKLKDKKLPFFIFRADGDQDRPNLLK